MRHAERSPTKYLPLMVAIIGKDSFKLMFFREASHPNLIELEKIPSETHPECFNVAIVRALSTKPSKSLIWISAKDQSNQFSLQRRFRFWTGIALRSQAWPHFTVKHQNSPEIVLLE